MKHLFLASFILLIASLDQDSSSVKDVSARIELSIIKNKKLGKLTAITVVIENQSDRKLYIDGIQPITFSISKQIRGKYVDYLSGWISNMSSAVDRKAIDKVIEDTPHSHIDCSKSNSFLTDSLSRKAFNQNLSMNSIKTNQDSTNLKLWLCTQFDELLYLKPKEIVETVIGISSLSEGHYKILFHFSNKSGYARKIIPSKDFDRFQLPTNLNGFQRWQGEINTDTLYLNIK